MVGSHVVQVHVGGGTERRGPGEARRPRRGVALLGRPQHQHRHAVHALHVILHGDRDLGLSHDGGDGPFPPPLGHPGVPEIVRQQVRTWTSHQDERGGAGRLEGGRTLARRVRERRRLHQHLPHSGHGSRAEPEHGAAGYGAEGVYGEGLPRQGDKGTLRAA